MGAESPPSSGAGGARRRRVAPVRAARASLPPHRRASSLLQLAGMCFSGEAGKEGTEEKGPRGRPAPRSSPCPRAAGAARVDPAREEECPPAAMEEGSCAAWRPR